MGTDLIVMLMPLLDHGLGFDPMAKSRYRQAFVPELAVEAFRRAVLPGRAGIDQGYVEVLAGRSAQQGSGNEFRTVIRAQDLGGAVNADQLGQDFHYPVRADRAGDIDG